MTISVVNCVLQELKRDPSGEMACLQRNESPSQSETLVHWIEMLHQNFNAKPSKGYAQLQHEAGQDNPFLDSLQGYCSERVKFTEFAVEAGERLAAEMNPYGFIDDGVLLLAHYSFVARDYLFILVTSRKPSVTLNEQLEIKENSYLDASDLQLAVRVDLDELDGGERPAVTFIKGKMGRKVSDFLLDFMRIEELTSAKENSVKLTTAVEEFCSVAELSPDEKKEVRQNIVEYCKEQSHAGELVELDALSQRVTQVVGDENQSLRDVAKQSEYQIDDSFPAVTSELNKLNRFSGQGKGVSIGFERHLLGERVIFDQQNNRLIINDIPPNLADQLSRYLSAGTEV